MITAHDQLTRYMSERYQHDILGKPIPVVTPHKDDALIAAIKAELARIDALKLGANLANRDFVSYQSRRVLEELLAELEGS